MKAIEMNQHTTPESFEQFVLINAPVGRVWESLIDVRLMGRWMGEPGMALAIETDWRAGSRIVVQGIHHVPFRNVGTVLQFEPEARLVYTHLSSISRLAEEPDSYTTLDFRLSPQGDAAALVFRASGFPTDSIFRHLNFYWLGTLQVLKRHVEEGVGEPGRRYRC